MKTGDVKDSVKSRIIALNGGNIRKKKVQNRYKHRPSFVINDHIVQ